MAPYSLTGSFDRDAPPECDLMYYATFRFALSIRGTEPSNIKNAGKIAVFRAAKG
jgi:hypothetical protein